MALLDLTILDWLDASPLVKLFYVFLAVACLTTIVRSLRLAWRLWSPWARAGSLRLQRKPGESAEPDAPPAESWRLAFAKVAATRHLFWATLIVSLAFAIGGFFPLFDDEYGDSHPARAGDWALAFVLQRTTARLELALLVCAAIAAAYVLFADALMRRRVTSAETRVVTLRRLVPLTLILSLAFALDDLFPTLARDAVRVCWGPGWVFFNAIQLFAGRLALGLLAVASVYSLYARADVRRLRAGA